MMKTVRQDCASSWNFFVTRCCRVFSHIQRRVDSKYSSQMFAARQVKRDADDGSKMVSQSNCM